MLRGALFRHERSLSDHHGQHERPLDHTLAHDRQANGMCFLIIDYGRTQVETGNAQGLFEGCGIEDLDVDARSRVSLGQEAVGESELQRLTPSWIGSSARRCVRNYPDVCAWSGYHRRRRHRTEHPGVLQPVGGVDLESDGRLTKRVISSLRHRGE